MRIPLSKLDVVARIVARVCTFRIRPSFESRRGAGCIVFFGSIEGGALIMDSTLHPII